MTKTHDFILKPWIAALSLGATLGGWAMLARQDFVAVNKQTAQSQTTPEAVVKTVYQALPPVPTVEALLAYASPGVGSVPPTVDLPSIPVVVAPQQSQAIQAQAPQQAPAAAPQLQTSPPKPTTRSSR